MGDSVAAAACAASFAIAALGLGNLYYASVFMSVAIVITSYSIHYTKLYDAARAASITVSVKPGSFGFSGIPRGT